MHCQKCPVARPAQHQPAAVNWLWTSVEIRSVENAKFEAKRELYANSRSCCTMGSGAVRWHFCPDPAYWGPTDCPVSTGCVTYADSKLRTWACICFSSCAFCAARCSSVISCPKSADLLVIAFGNHNRGLFSQVLDRRLRVFVREQDGQDDHDGDANDDVGLRLFGNRALWPDRLIAKPGPVRLLFGRLEFCPSWITAPGA